MYAACNVTEFVLRLPGSANRVHSRPEEGRSLTLMRKKEGPSENPSPAGQFQPLTSDRRQRRAYHLSSDGNANDVNDSSCTYRRSLPDTGDGAPLRGALESFCGSLTQSGFPLQNQKLDGLVEAASTTRHIGHHGGNTNAACLTAPLCCSGGTTSDRRPSLPTSSGYPSATYKGLHGLETSILLGRART